MSTGGLDSRKRVLRTLEHKEPDRVPLDLGGSVLTGMHASSVYQLRQVLRLDPPGAPVKVTDTYQMLGEIAADLADALGVDVVSLPTPATLFGYRKEGWKPWTLFDGTPVLVPEGFTTEPDAQGDILMYPEGDRSVPPSGRMPHGGFYFDEIVRQPPLREEALDPEDNAEEFVPISAADLSYYASGAKRLHEQTDRAIFAGFCYTSFGDIALIPAPWLKRPRGIRDIEEWYVSTLTRRDYVYKVFERQCEVALANFQKLHAAIGDMPLVALITGTDFGMQSGPFISPQTYRDLYKPFHLEVNDWLHRTTPWKTFIHSCGSVAELIPDFVDAGFDILNPVQTAAAGMEPAVLKERFGDRVTFWGGGVDTQRTLPFGTPEEIRRQVSDRMRIFGKGGGFVFAAIHNIQAGVPVENLLALFESVREYR
jgi:hypothetical protein